MIPINKKTEELNPRQKEALRLHAKGLTAIEAARSLGYTDKHFSKLKYTSPGREYFQQLLDISAEKIATELPVFIEKALENLHEQLNSPNVTRRDRASMFVLRYMGSPLLDRLTENASASDGVTIDLTGQPIETDFQTSINPDANDAQEAHNHEQPSTNQIS